MELNVKNIEIAIRNLSKAENVDEGDKKWICINGKRYSMTLQKEKPANA